jgi:hypothetical protein
VFNGGSYSVGPEQLGEWCMAGREPLLIMHRTRLSRCILCSPACGMSSRGQVVYGACSAAAAVCRPHACR